MSNGDILPARPKNVDLTLQVRHLPDAAREVYDFRPLALHVAAALHSSTVASAR